MYILVFAQELELRSLVELVYVYVDLCDSQNMSKGGAVYLRSTPHPGFQSPPGLWTIFSRESQPKPSFVTGILGGG